MMSVDEPAKDFQGLELDHAGISVMLNRVTPGAAATPVYLHGRALACVNRKRGCQGH